MNDAEMDGDMARRQRRLQKVTVLGSVINLGLVALKFVAGTVGHSAAMLADAVHSCSDFATDVVVMVFVRLGAKPWDESHDYGHGKFETLATFIIGVALLAVGVLIAVGGVQKIVFVAGGGTLPAPGMLAFVVALISIALKEWAYRFTAKAGKEERSETVVANAWHHRSDALSSIGTAAGIGGAIFLGEKWTVLDPIAAVIVSVFIFKVAIELTIQALDELLEKSLPKETEDEIVSLAEQEEGVSEIHHLCTRRIGNNIAIEMHLRLPAQMNLYDCHERTTAIENRLRERFGQGTHITLHVEPTKVKGRYQPPTEDTTARPAGAERYEAEDVCNG